MGIIQFGVALAALFYGAVNSSETVGARNVIGHESGFVWRAGPIGVFDAASHPNFACSGVDSRNAFGSERVFAVQTDSRFLALHNGSSLSVVNQFRDTRSLVAREDEPVDGGADLYGRKVAAVPEVDENSEVADAEWLDINFQNPDPRTSIDFGRNGLNGMFALFENLVDVDRYARAYNYDPYIHNPDTVIFVALGQKIKPDSNDHAPDYTQLGKTQFKHSDSLHSTLWLLFMTLTLGLGAGVMLGIFIAVRRRF